MTYIREGLYGMREASSMMSDAQIMTVIWKCTYDIEKKESGRNKIKHLKTEVWRVAVRLYASEVFWGLSKKEALNMN